MAIADVVANRAMLLILDNFEHVAAAADVATLLTRCPRLTLVVTSRSQLRLNAEHVYAVRPLSAPEEGADIDLKRLQVSPAARLFIERTAAAGRGYQVTDADAPAVAELMRQLDGLPLAIELAAARTNVLTPPALLRRLGAQWDLISGGGADLPKRQRGLRATIEWSHSLLSEPERTLFARLAPLKGGFTLEIIERVCADSLCGDALETLSNLVDHSLVEADKRAGVGPRFHMAQTIRAYASERLRASGELVKVQQSLACFFAEWVEEAGPLLRGRDQRAWVERVEVEMANIRVAAAASLELGDVALVVRMFRWTSVVWWVRGQVASVKDLIARADARTGELSQPTRAHLDWLVGKVSYLTGEYERAERRLVSALVSLDGDWRAAADARLMLVALSLVRGDPIVDQEAVLHALQDYRAEDDLWGAVLALSLLGGIAASSGEVEVAERHHREALAIAQVLDHDELQVQELVGLGFLSFVRGDYSVAQDLIAAGAAKLQGLPYEEGQALCLEAYAALAVEADDAAHAAVLLGAADEIRSRLQLPIWPGLRSILDDYRARLRRLLDEEALTTAWRTGQRTGGLELLQGEREAAEKSSVNQV